MNAPQPGEGYLGGAEKQDSPSLRVARITAWRKHRDRHGLRCLNISDRALRLLVVIGEYCDYKTMRLTTTDDDLAHLMGVSTRTVKRARPEAVEAGYLVVLVLGRKQGMSDEGPSVYSLAVPACPKCEAQGASSVTLEEAGGAQGDTQGDTQGDSSVPPSQSPEFKVQSQSSQTDQTDLSSPDEQVADSLAGARQLPAGQTDGRGSTRIAALGWEPEKVAAFIAFTRASKPGIRDPLKWTWEKAEWAGLVADFQAEWAKRQRQQRAASRTEALARFTEQERTVVSWTMGVGFHDLEKVGSASFADLMTTDVLHNLACHVRDKPFSLLAAAVTDLGLDLPKVTEADEPIRQIPVKPSADLIESAWDDGLPVSRADDNDWRFH